MSNLDFFGNTQPNTNFNRDNMLKINMEHDKKISFDYFHKTYENECSLNDKLNVKKGFTEDKKLSCQNFDYNLINQIIKEKENCKLYNN
jgi:hypothetical protein